MKSARKLSATAIYPLTSLSFMLLAWQKSELEDFVLSDSDCDDGDESNSDGEPTVKYGTEEEYILYVPPPCSIANRLQTHLSRRMERVQTHYMVLGVETLFSHNPKLQEHLVAKYDGKLVASVRPLIPTLLPIAY